MALSPINYNLGLTTPADRVLQGAAMGQGLIQQAEQRGFAQQDEARRAELQPLRVRQAELDIERETALAPLQIEAAQLRINQAQQNLDSQRQQQERSRMAREGMANLVELGKDAGFEDFASFYAQFPELGSETLSLFNALDENRRKPLVGTLAQAAAAIKAGNVDAGIEVAEQFVEAARNAGDTTLADMGQAAIDLAKLNPDAAYVQIGTLLQQIDPEIAKVALGSGSKVRATEILPDGTVIKVTDEGTIVQSPSGEVITGEEAAAAIRAARDFGVDIARQTSAARETGKLGTQADLGAAASAAKRLGEVTIDQAEKSFEALGKVQASIGNFDTAIDALDRGAKSGAIQKYLPNITGASAELENAMNRLGLDVIGSVAFGALSQAEMSLAMETAVPRNLNEADLRDWLVRKRDAQEKAADALWNAAKYLSKPGNTLNTFLEEQGRSNQGAEIPADPDEQFILDMEAKMKRKELFTTEERARIKQLAEQ